MDMDDDDAFLYGDEPETAASAQSTESAASLAQAQASSVSASMAASLAAYGIEPSAAVVEPLAENPEDGGVEEEDPEEDDDEESDEDDVKFVFTGNTRSLDLRKPQQQTSVVGIGKWAHASTGVSQATPAPATQPGYIAGTPAKAQSGEQTTEYTPVTRPPATPQPVNALVNPPLTTAATAQAQAQAQGTAPVSYAQPTTNQPSNGAPVNPNLPSSTLPPVIAPGSAAKVDPSNPSGVVPSTGSSVYDIDAAMFEGSGQPWRQPGAVISDYFNFGFDEVTYPRFLRYRAEMEQGVKALSNLPQMASLTPDIANMLHLNNPMNQMNQLNQMNQMAQMSQMNGGMGMGGMMPQQMQAQMQQMQQMMTMQGMDVGMMQGMQGQPGMINQIGTMGARQGLVRPTPTTQAVHATPAPTVPAPTPVTASAAVVAADSKVKQEEGEHVEPSSTPQPATTQALPAVRGVVAGRGGMRGAVPLGPRATATGTGVPNAPKGPKAGRFKDVDRVNDNASTGGLDYGDDEERERSRSPRKSRDRSRAQSKDTRDRKSKEKEKDRERERERGEYNEHDEGYVSEDRDRERRKRKEKESEKEKSKKKDVKAEKGVLGPDGWEDGEDDERRSSRRKRSPSEESTHRRSKRR